MNAQDAARGHPRGEHHRPARSNVLRLPYASAAIAATRHRVRADLADFGIPTPVLDDVEVIASELMSNSLRHARAIAGGVLLLGWRIEDDELTVRVTDGGSRHSVTTRDVGPMDDSGRGLHIVEALAAGWGVVEHPGGLRTVWAAVPLPHAVTSPRRQAALRAQPSTGAQPAAAGAPRPGLRLVR